MITSIEQYKDALRATQQEVESKADNMLGDPELVRDFLSSTLNFHQFFPNQKYNDLEFFKKVLFQTEFRAVERKIDLDTLYDMIQVEGDLDFLNHVGKKPYIFASFHYGILGAIIAWIMREGFHMSMLSAKDDGLTGEMLHDSAPKNIEILDASSVDVMIKLVHSIRQNKCILGLVDGVWGVNKDEDRKSFQSVKLMNHSFLFKKGIPMIAYATGAQMIPVLARRDSDSGKIIVRFEKPIDVNKDIPKNQFIEESLQTCFDIFEGYVQKYPEQWDFWNVCHQFLEKPNSFVQQQVKPSFKSKILLLFNKGKYRFNFEYFDLLMGGQKNYLFKRQTQSCFAISQNLSRFLGQIPADGQKISILNKQVNKSILQDLLEKQVLISA